MGIEFVRASLTDIPKIIEVRNKSFLEDFIKYGECPGYNCSSERLSHTIQERYVFNIMYDENTVGNISVSDDGNDQFHLHCLCVIPEYENKGIGQESIKFIENRFPTAKHWSLVTPADKMRSHYFYQKLGYQIVKEYIDGTVKLVRFEKEMIR